MNFLSIILQATSAKGGGENFLFFLMIIGVIVLIYYLFIIRPEKKVKCKIKQMEKEFKEIIIPKYGFSREKLIETYSRRCVDGGYCNKYKFILFGVKDRKIIFFEGSYMISSYSCYNRLYEIKHLFDIPIENIETVGGKQRGNIIELIIERSDDKIIKLSPYCTNVGVQVEIVNTLIDAFGKLLNNGMMTEIQISNTNSEIHDTLKEKEKNADIQALKTIGKVVGGTAIITGGAAALGVRNWSRDR